MADVTPVEGCPISPVVDLVFSRWTTPILWTLNEFGRQRFVELQRRIAITPKVLTQRLRQLERDGMITRTYYAGVPPRVEYEITSLGRSLGPLFASLSAWQPNLEQVERAREAYDALESGSSKKPRRTSVMPPTEGRPALSGETERVGLDPD